MRGPGFLFKLCGFSVVLMIAALLGNYFSGQSKPELAAALEQKIKNRITNFEQFDLTNKLELRRFYAKEQCGVFLFNRDSLYFWNTSRLPIEIKPSEISQTCGILQMRTGLFLVAKRVITNEQTALMLSLLRPNYALQNNYLSNVFEPWTGLPKEIRLGKFSEAAVPINIDGKPAFYIDGDEDRYYPDISNTVCALLLLFAFLLFVTSSLALAQSKSAKTLAIVFAAILGVRGILLMTKTPALLYRSFLYDVRIFGDASSWLNAYMGDMFLNAGLLAVGLVYLLVSVKSGILSNKPAWLAWLTTITLVLGMLGYQQALNSLVTNSTIRFDFMHAVNVEAPLVLAFVILCFYGLSIYLALLVFFTLFKSGRMLPRLLLPGVGITVVIINLIKNESATAIETYWPFSLLLLQILAGFLPLMRPKLSLSVFVVFLALLSSQLLNNVIKRNSANDLELLSYRLGERLDPMLENEFRLLPEKIKNDQNIRNLLRVLPAGAEGIDLLLRQHYLAGYFDRYQTELQLFDNDCHPLLPAKDAVMDNTGYFEDVIFYQSDTIERNSLFFVRDHLRNTRYVAKIELGNNTLYLRLDRKQTEDLGTFPDLLLDQSQQRHEKLSGFSHGVYRTKQLTAQVGDISYPLFLPDSNAIVATYPAYQHHYFLPDAGTTIIISEKATSVRDFFTSNSYLLLFFALFTFLLYALYFGIFTMRFRMPSLTRRIQSTVIVLLLLSMSAIGYTSAKLVRGQFEEDNKRELEEKTQIILAELNNAFRQNEMFDESRRELVNLKLREFARLFNTPLSVFSGDGRLFTTSEDKLYELGLSAKLVNPLALDQIGNNKRSSIPVTEKAGSLSYISYYTPILNRENEVTGYINLPYFARQSALVAELSGVVSGLVNVYVLLFVLSLIAGLVLSGYITRPLRLIQQQIAKITLGAQNEKISWNSKDEIGKLVDEYNTMLKKLEESAMLLAQSERESAWREMAKQVAHEIKNPLTPMKLNLQYLQHVVKSNDEDFKEKFNKSASAIIEQIDALATIATEFSNFARLPSGSFEEFDLADCVAAAVQLFEDNNRVQLIHEKPANALFIRADKEQCLRVFNNVIKNAVQACSEIDHALVTLQYQINQDDVTVIVSDNGCGIDEEQKNKIFQPNFTTKSYGSGLGLSMVKNIMDGFGGKVWFESKTGEGTRFMLYFPLSKSRQ